MINDSDTHIPNLETKEKKTSPEKSHIISILTFPKSCIILCTVECSEKGVEPKDPSPQAENNVKKSYELNSKRINHCYIYKPKVEFTYVSCYERHL